MGLSEERDKIGDAARAVIKDALLLKEAAERDLAEARAARDTILRWCDEDAGSHSGFIAIADLRAALSGVTPKEAPDA
jgi:hypothetical protein